MKNNDREYIKKLFDEDGIKAPDSLSEDRIRAMIDDAGAAPAGGSDTGGQKETRKRTVIETMRAGRRRRRNLIAAAACLMLAICLVPAVKTAASPHPGRTVEAGAGMEKFESEKQLDKQIRYMLESETGKLYFARKDTDVDVIAEGDMDMMDAAESSAAPGAQANAAAPSVLGEGSAPAHSETYVQVEGIDEADIVKTDGRYIYFASYMSNKVSIVSAKDGKTEKAGSVNCSRDDIGVSDIYIKGDRLVVIGRDSSGKVTEDTGIAYRQSTAAAVYDISDRSEPKLIKRVSQSGGLLSSRLIGDEICLVTNDFIYEFRKGKNVPFIDCGDGFTKLSVEGITVFPDAGRPCYTVVSMIAIDGGRDAKVSVKTKAVLGGSEEVYCNGIDLYVSMTYVPGREGTASPFYYGEGTRTRILKMSLENGKVRPSASAAVEGTLNDQFSMDASGGTFKVATTSHSDQGDANNLFVLDEDMKEIGSLTDFARDEHIEAVRYVKDKAYVITYRQTDPLFIIDLSDPTDPEIEGHVKISGFSTLLVPVDEDHLLGLGFSTETTEFGEATDGVKLALFDISDPSKPKVADSREFSGMASEVQYDHKALLVDPAGEYYAFPYSLWSEDEGADGFGMKVFSAKDGRIGDIRDLASEEEVMRGVAIGDHIYEICADDSVSGHKVR